MPYHARMRNGWTNENLASFILRMFSFVAQPATVSDDVGADFSCTLFRTVRDETGQDYLIPRNSFAIQIKSNAERFDVSNKTSFLSELEIPVFVGVVDRKALKLTIYSGEYLPIFFSHVGIPERLKIDLCERAEVDADEYFTESRNQILVLRFPKVCEIHADIEQEALNLKVQTIYELCSHIQLNMSSRASHSYLFRAFERDPSSTRVIVFAGPSSAETFRDNFFGRLAEALFNLQWIQQNGVAELNPREVELFCHLYEELKDVYGPPNAVGLFEGPIDYLRDQMRLESSAND